MTAAKTPVAFAELVDRLAAEYPAAGTERIERLLIELVESGLLCTELLPPTHCTDPLAHVQTVLERTPTQEKDKLRELAALFDQYTRAPLGSGRTVWATANAAARELHSTGRGSPIQVDLRIDAEVTLPAAVAREAESAASALLRLSPAHGSAPHIANYYFEFLDKYGFGNAVPVKEVLDSERGIGPPAGYRLPGNSRFSEPTADRDGTRHRKLGELAQQALLSGSDEVVLDDATITELEPEAEPANPPSTAELNFQLLATSLPAIEQGDFRLISAPAAGRIAGAMFGRFAYLFADNEALATVMPPAEENLVRAQLAFQPVGGRQSNVMRVPPVLDGTLAVGIFDERANADVLGLDDVGIVAEPGGLTLVSLRDHKRITVFSPQMLDPIHRTPNAARLLREITADGARKLIPWQWGDVDCLAYLPRVRYGRTVLAQARWRPPRELAGTDTDSTEWNAALDRWRKHMGVPDVVQARYTDHSVELDLTAPLHRRLFRDELRRKPDLVVTETARRCESDFDWLGGHVNEIVVPLSSRRTASTSAHSPTDSGASMRWKPASARRSVPPGSEWVFAKLYCAPERHQEILCTHLPRLLAAAPSTVDRWFFIRYVDPDHHLRIRFHGEPETMNQSLLPALHAWARELHDGGLIRKLVLDNYEPEIDRYGGQEIIDAAERVFRADSEAVLTQLPLRWNADEELPEEVFAAVNFVDLLRQLDPQWTSWYEHMEVQHYDGMHKHVRRAVDLADELLGEARASSNDTVPAIREACKHRAPAVRAYAEIMRTADRHTPQRYRAAVDSLLHMHHNRLLGIDNEREKRVHAVTSRVAAAHRGRARAT